MARKTKKGAGKRPLGPKEALELLSLISQVNPTDRGLPRAETETRYRRKSRLIGRLIELFGEDLDVVPEPGQEDVVLLRHRSSGRGVHGRISELDEEAASWVRLRRDQELSGQEAWAEPTSPGQARPHQPPQEVDRDPGEVTCPEELVQMGLAAQREFAYDRAWACLDRALELCRGASLAALPLLDLLVNHLGAYYDALALAPLLAAEAAADPQACLLLGLAAAHDGQVERAERWLRGHESPVAAEAYLVLAQGALDDDLERAEAFLSQARHQGGPPLEVKRLQEEILRRTSQAWAGHEMEILRLLEEEGAHEAERAARELLALWPESAVAGRVIRQAEGARRREMVRRLLAQAHKALEGGDLSSAAQHLRSAQEQGAAREALEPLQARLEAGEAARREQARLEETLDLLEGAERVPALMAYLALEGPLRSRVRQARPMAILGWLDRAELPPSRGQSQAVAEAVAALEAALGLMEEDRRRAMALVEGHLPLLRELPGARGVLEDLEFQWRLWRERQAALDLDRACAALAQGRWGEARLISRDIDVSLLSPEGAGRFREMAEEIRREEELQRLLLKVERALEEEHFWPAHRAIGRLLEMIDEKEAPPLLALQRKVVGRIKRDLSWQEREGGEMARLFRPTIRVIPEDGTVLLGSYRRGRMFLELLDQATSRVLRSASIRLPENKSWLLSLVDGRSIWLCGLKGEILWLDRHTWEPTHRFSVSHLVKVGIPILHYCPMPDEPRLWVIQTPNMRGSKGDLTISLIDLRRKRVECRHFYERAGFCRDLICREGEEPLLIVTKDEETKDIVDSKGALRFRARIHVPSKESWQKGLSEFPSQATVRHPTEERLIFYTAILGEEEPSGLAFQEMGAQGHVAPPFVLADTVFTSFAPYYLQPCRKQGLLFCTITVPDESMGGKRRLVAFRPSTEGWEEIYRVPVPTRTFFLCGDLFDRQAIGLVQDLEGTKVEILGPEPPSISMEGNRLLNRIYSVSTCLPAACTMMPRTPEMERLNNSFLAMSGEERLSFVETLMDRCNKSPEEILKLVAAAISQTLSEDLLRDMVKVGWERCHAPPGLGVIYAQTFLNAGLFGQIRDILMPLVEDSCPTPPAYKRHAYHILGLCDFVEGDAVQAKKHWLEGEKHKGECDLNRWLALLEPLPENLKEDWGRDEALIIQLRQALHKAASLVAKGDWEAVIALLDHPLIWYAQEAITMAHLAKACLHHADSRPEFVFLRTMALASFLEPKWSLIFPGEDKTEWLKEMTREAFVGLEEGC